VTSDSWLKLSINFASPLPSNLLSHHFWVGNKVLAQPQTQELLKCRKSSVRFSALPSVCAQRRACATIPSMTLFSYNPEMLSVFSAILRDRKVWVSAGVQSENLLNNTKTMFFSLRLAGLALPYGWLNTEVNFVLSVGELSEEFSDIYTVIWEDFSN